jgi:squalene-associated FAD-dependent desaturase
VDAPVSAGPPLPSRADAVVIGSGFAGMSAAVRLAERGRRVIVLEEAPRFGGRATAFVDRESNESIDNGQHALFGCYRQTYDFLKRIGAEKLAPLQPRLSLTMAGEGRLETLECPRLRPPFQLLAGLMRWKGVPVSDRLSALRLFSFLRRVSSKGPAAVAAEVPATQTVSEWLRNHGQSPTLCRWLWNPLAIAALNQSPDVAAAAPFVRVLAELFGSDPGAASIGLATVPLDELFVTPSAAFIRARGGDVAGRARAGVRVTSTGGFMVRAGDAEIAAPIVISAVPWHSFSRLWDEDVPAGVGDVAAAASRMTASPIVTVNLWLDRSGAALAQKVPSFVGFADGPMHWLFDKSTLIRGVRHLSIVASGADDLVRMDNAAITTAAHAQIQRAIPALAGCAVERSVVVREPRATFSLAPGGPQRPGSVTGLEGFYLAGDWTDTGLPGTIEGAVVSGHAAADAALGKR